MFLLGTSIRLYRLRDRGCKYMSVCACVFVGVCIMCV